MAPHLSAGQLDRLAGEELAAAQAELAAAGLLTAATAGELAQTALAHAEETPAAATAWLTLAQAILAVTPLQPSAAAWVAYAQARVATLAGDLAGAETQLLAARQQWQTAGDDLMFARSSLGLTQVLTMLGRYADAEAVIRPAIAQLDDLGAAPQAAAARQNLATLLSYQERHADALAVNLAARTALTALLENAPDAARADLLPRLARVDMAIALAQTHLDDPAAAETTLRSAADRLLATDDDLDRGRVYANLGHLLARTGRYADALAAFDQAARALLGTDDPDAAPERWPRADVLFLEQARVYLVLNLLPEAAASLGRATPLFRTTGQRYELGQALLTGGLLAAAQGDFAAATAAFAEAAAIFAELDNRFWLQQVDLAQADLAFRRGDLAAAARRLTTVQSPIANLQSPSTPDRLTLAELHLLAADIALAQHDGAGCAAQLAAAAQALGLADLMAAPELPAAHLQLRLLHLTGRRLRSQGDAAAARTHFAQAVDLLEAQRATFALEELRSAFLADKMAVYTDLVLSLLDAPPPGENAVAAAFAVVERARSRALLERLLAATAAGDAGSAVAEDVQAAARRQQLHWLYNRWLGESGSRGGSADLVTAIRTHEAALERIERRAGNAPVASAPVDLAALQRVLAADQEAIVYFTAGDEVLAFVVGPQQATVVRSLCRYADLTAALAELHFQVGRAEVGDEPTPTRAARLLHGARQALHTVYQLVCAPLMSSLTAARLLVIPHGDLHGVPFAALWDGERYLLERCEIAYAASASLAVHHAAAHDAPRAALAALAIDDASIPQALAEVQAAAAHFPAARLYLGTEASLAGLHQAAAASDVLHVATHGLFRSDNPFFSALKLADGWIDVRAIYRLPLRARLVVLSACESGAVRVQGGGEAVGLVRGFLGAGAHALVVSLWNVHDASAAALMDRFYAALTAAGCSGAPAALRSAQLAAAQTGAHPYFWAPYIAYDSAAMS
jgi:CHAT domain-containing protein